MRKGNTRSNVGANRLKDIVAGNYYKNKAHVDKDDQNPRLFFLSLYIPPFVSHNIPSKQTSFLSPSLYIDPQLQIFQSSYV